MQGRKRRAPCGRVFPLLAVAAVVVCSSGAPALAESAEATLTVTVNGAGYVAIGPNGSICSSTCTFQFAIGTGVSLTPTAGDGYSFTGWGQACTGAGDTCTLELKGDTTVAAVFATVAETTTTPSTTTTETTVGGGPSAPPPVRPPVTRPPLTPPVVKPKPRPRPNPPPVETRPTITVPVSTSAPSATPPKPHVHLVQPSPGYGPAGSLDAPGGLQFGGSEAAASFDSELDRALATLQTGAVAFNVPGSMHLGSTAEIQLLLSLAQKTATLQTQISAAGEKSGATVRVSRDVSAQLTGIGFKIVAETPTRQAVSRSDNTEWRWQIEPTSSGPHHLHLTLSAFVHLQGGDRERMVKTFERKLDINVTLFERVSTFVGGNWKWLWTTILLPLAAGAVRRMRSRSATDTPPPAPHGP